MERAHNPNISRSREAASMNRVLQVAFAVTLGSLAGVAATAAQGARFGVGGGLLSPMGDYKDLDKTGWHGLVRVDLSIPMRSEEHTSELQSRLHLVCRLLLR